MTTYELTNKQREYFGLDPIKSHWDKVLFKGDTYRPDSTLYFDRDIIKRHIISTEEKYSEVHYDELTKDRKTLIPKTDKGKEKKLTPSVLEQRQPLGVYLYADTFGDLTIGSHSTQTTFYSNRWEKEQNKNKTDISNIVDEFILKSPQNHLTEIKAFKLAKRKNVKFKMGDYFSFKINREEFGFGRLLLDINKLRKKGLLPEEHGLNLLMGPPLIVKLYAFKSKTKHIDVSLLDNKPTLPSDVMMDNLLLYGEYEIIGHKDLLETEFEFPISFGKSIDQRRVVFLQWGLIHKELPIDKFSKYTVGEDPFSQNPYGYYAIGFRPSYDTIDIVKAISKNGVFDYDTCTHFSAVKDLRNPKSDKVRREIFKVFGLNPDKNYIENCKLSGTSLTTDLIKQLK